MNNIKPEAFLPKTPSKRARLPCGRRRRRSGLRGEFTPAAGSAGRAEAGGQISKAQTPASSLVRLLALFVFYDGHVPGFELGAEGFDVRRLEADGFIFRTHNPFDFGCYLIGPALEKFAALGGGPRPSPLPIKISNVNHPLT